MPDDRIRFSADPPITPGKDVSYTWEIEGYYPSFSDTASGGSFVYEFDTYGEYEVTLIVEDTNGNTDPVTQTVTVAGDGPTADIRITPSDPNPGNSVTFDATGSTAPAGDIVDYEWRYETNRGSTRSTSGTSFSYEYSSYGSYDVELTVTDNGGATDTVTKTVEVGGEGPTAAFSFTPSDPVADEKVTFDASASTAPSGEIVEYDWDVEDPCCNVNRDRDGESFTYEYPSYGSYDVQLTVTDNGGATDTVTKMVEVGGEGPTAAFSFTPSDPELDDRIVFDASSSQEGTLPIDGYRWYVDGIRQYSQSGPRAAFTTNSYGIFTIGLEVEGEGGKISRTTAEVQIGDEADIIDNPEFSHRDYGTSRVVSKFVVGNCDDGTKAQREEHLRFCVDAASGMRSPEAAVLD